MGREKKGVSVEELSQGTSLIRILPDLNVIKIGGQSIMDRGRKALFPLIREIIRNKKRHKILIGVGGGTRSRHAYSLALELGMPTGIIARLGASISRQNARMLHMLLSSHGGIFIPKEAFEMTSLYVATGCIPIVCGMPPYEYWEEPPEKGRIPGSRTDVGVFLIAEFFGARSMIFVKDEDGLYTADPKKDRKAKLIKRASIDEIIGLKDLVIERKVLELLRTTRHIKSIQIINGLKKGMLTSALNGKAVGSIIYRS